MWVTWGRKPLSEGRGPEVGTCLLCLRNNEEAVSPSLGSKGGALPAVKVREPGQMVQGLGATSGPGFYVVSF